MVKNKKPFNVASLDASKLKNVDVPVVKNSGVTTMPNRGDKDVILDCQPVISFPKGTVKASLLTYENVYLVDHLGNKVLAEVEIETEIGQTVIIKPIGDLCPGSQYFYRFSNKLRDEKGKKISMPDNSISFTTAKE